MKLTNFSIVNIISTLKEFEDKNLSEYLLCEEEKEIDFENNVIY